MEEPKGVIACIINKDGDVLSSVSDFDGSGYGGFSLMESQKLRAKEAVKAQFCKEFLPVFVWTKIRPHTMDRIVSDLIDTKEIKLFFKAVGHDDDI